MVENRVEHDTIGLPIVHDLMLKAVVKDEHLTVAPRPRLVADAQRRTGRDGEPDVHAQAKELDEKPRSSLDVQA